MKRLFIVASLAIMAAGCQKTEVQNEVNNVIGFNTEVGKQTRAIVQDSNEKAYPVDQPFGVFAYGYDNGVANEDRVMDHVEIAKDGSWKANDGFTYYWPNDPDNYINFYAYSPVLAAKHNGQALPNHMVMNGNFEHTEEAGLSITGYQHTNLYVDFMVADPITEATYTDQNGTAADEPDNVPATFHHEMTQVNFTVKIVEDGDYPGVDFKFKSITFNNVYNKANYTNSTLKPNATYAVGSWSPSNPSTIQIFPVKMYDASSAPNGAPGIAADETFVILHTDARQDDPTTSEVNEASSAKTTFSTTPVTMIPQELCATVEADVEEGVAAVNGQSFTIEYEIYGKGVTTETISKTFDFADNASTVWAPNKRITYTLTIGLKEITFAPTVETWDPTTGSYDLTNDKPTPSTPSTDEGAGDTNEGQGDGTN